MLVRYIKANDREACHGTQFERVGALIRYIKCKRLPTRGRMNLSELASGVSKRNISTSRY